MGKMLGYGRVSSDQQDIATQKAKLEKLGAVVVFTETGNGSWLERSRPTRSRPSPARPGDELLALHPDRLARDTGDLLTIAKRVVERARSSRSTIPKSFSTAPT